MNKWLLLLLLLPPVYVVYITYCMKKTANEKVSHTAPYVLILGAKLFGDKPSLSLQNRLDVALGYLHSHPKVKVVVSGGQGDDEDISEALSMSRYLMENGIGKERILLEDRSTSTYENIKYSKEFIPENAKLGIIVTNDYHLYRSIQIAKDADLKVEGLPAKTPQITLLKAYSREYLSVTKYYVETYFLKK